MRNSSRIRNLVELKARQEQERQERQQRERQRYPFEQPQTAKNSLTSSTAAAAVPTTCSQSRARRWLERQNKLL